MNSRRPWARLRSCRVLSLSLLAAVAAACGGGGGGGGSGAGGGPPGQAAANVAFTGFTFRVGQGVPFSDPPQENLNQVPPTIGGPLDITLIFNFDGVPQGPFNQGNLPVYTTPSEISPDAGASAGTPVIPAKGSYVLVGNTVEFRPFIPTAPMQASLSAPADAVPGLFPGSTYTAQVVTAAGQKIQNLKGAGGTVKFDTTSLPGAYFSSGSDNGLAPRVVATVPADGATGVSPGPYSNFAPGAELPSFPPEDPQFTLTFDHALNPSAENLEGKDWDADGYVDANFFLRAQATRLIVALDVPSGSTLGNAAPFPALSGLSADQSVQSDGSDIFLHGPSTFPGGDLGLLLTPSSLAVARDPDLLFVVLRVDASTDLLSVVDHVLGDPRSADIAAAAIDTGLAGLTGLITLQNGRLIAFDTGTRRLYELMPEVTRNRPLGEPVLNALTVADGTIGFRSDVFPVGVDVLDLSQSPTGDLYALTSVAGNAFPQLQLLAPIDPDLNGAFEPGEGTPLGAQALQFADPYAAIAFIDADTLYGLNRGTDAIDTLTLAAGFSGTTVTGVAAYGVPLAGLPGGLSPALDLEVGYLNADVTVTVVNNEASGAIVRLEPKGVLPIGERLDVMQRYALATSGGVSMANEVVGEPKSVLGAERIISVTTSDPLNTVGPCDAADPAARVNDVMEETFSDNLLEDPTPTGLSPLAEWAKPVSGGLTSGHLRASVGADDDPPLGDFAPVPNANFDPTKAYPQAGSVTAAHFKYVFLDTDVQTFPLPNGETPNVTQNVTVFGGDFQFHDFIIPAGVWVRAKGSNPLRIAASGKVEISGVLDVSGSPGEDDITFDSAFIPTSGGSGGAGGGRGGDGHPTVYPPNVVPSINGLFVAPYATPESGEHGFGLSLLPTGELSGGQQEGGRGGVSTLGYNPDDNGYPDLKQQGNNTEFSRPPGGGGGSYYFHGIKSHNGTGSYRVQSSSSWGNFTLCPTNDKINDAVYGLEELQYCFGQAPNPLQCVYMQGTPSDPVRFQAPTEPGSLIFSDANPNNDYLGGNGELKYLLGGQGGGGGGTRIDSMKHQLWGTYPFGFPTNPLPPLGAGPPCYPLLFLGFFASPSVFDAKGGGGGGGAGSVLIRSLGEIRVTRTGHILAFGGDGGGGETIGNSNYAGGGGGGSGGAVILQAAGEIIIEADAGHFSPGYTDPGTLAEGAAIDVSGGRGWDAIDNPSGTTSPPGGNGYGTFGRSDGGQGGFGMIQLQEGSGDGMPTVEQGAFLFAKQYAMIKRYKNADTLVTQNENVWFNTAASAGADFLRYIDMHYYRFFKFVATGPQNNWFVLNGADPPIIQVSDPGNIPEYQLDTKMLDYFGRRVVMEPQPERILKTYNGYDANFKEIGSTGQLPGTTYLSTDEIPLSIWLKEPDGTPPKEVVDGIEQFSPGNLIDRLPVIHPSKTPPEFGTVSRGTSKWLDFNGVALRARDLTGLAPPLFSEGFNGTYNALNAPPPPGQDGQVILGGEVVDKPAHFVANTGPAPFGKKLCSTGLPPHPDFNDVKVDAQEFAIENAITNNATVVVQFQGSLPIRAGSHVPDPDTLTDWTTDLSQLSGYPLIRFQVVFDVSKDHELYPFSINSMKPAVDNVRIRAKY